MKTKAIYGIVGCLLVLAAGCSHSDEMPQPPADMVDFTLSVASVNSGNTFLAEELPQAEKIHTLRVIIFDGDGKVEHNVLVYDNATTGVEEVSNETFSVKTNDSKKVYLLANAEQLPDLDLDHEEGLKRRIDEYDRVTLDYIRNAKSLPMSSSYNFSVEYKNTDCGVLYVAYAATKFTFTLTNAMGPGTNLGVSGFTIDKAASTSYLYPHGADKWLSDLYNGKTVKTYDIPNSVIHETFRKDDFSRVVLTDGESYTFPPIYITESKNITLNQEQSYSVGLKIGTGPNASDDHFRDVQLTDGVTPLSSLFRGTHVNVKVKVKSLDEIEIVKGIFGMIKPWQEIEEVTGTLEEKP